MKLHSRLSPQILKYRLSIAALSAAIGLSFVANIAPVYASEPVTIVRDGSDELAGLYTDNLTGNYAQKVGDIKLAAQVFVREWERNKDNRELFDRALRAYMVFGDIENAKKIIAEVDPSFYNDDVRLILASELLYNGKAKDAAAELTTEESEESSYTKTRAYYSRNLKAWALAKAGKKDAAFAIASEKSGIKSIDAAGDYAIGLLYQYFGNRDEALAAYENAFNAGIYNTTGIEAYVRLLAITKQKDKALQVLSELQTSAYPLEMYGSLEQMVKDGKAKALKKKSRKDFNKYVGDSLAIISTAMASDFRNGSPMAELTIARKFNPEAYSTNISASTILNALKIKDEAVAQLRAVPLNSLYGDQASGLLAGLVFDNNKQEGLKISEAALAAHPTIANRVGTAIFYLDMGDNQKAVDLYNSAISETEANDGKAFGVELWQMYFGRANANLGLDNQQAAIADLRKANELQPQNATLMNSLGYTLADNNIDLPEAQKLLETAVQLNPSSGETLDSLGWLLFRIGKYDEALDKLELAISISPDVGEIAEHLGDAYYRTNRKIEATMEWEKAARLYDKDKDKERATKKAAEGLPSTTSRMAQSEPTA